MSPRPRVLATCIVFLVAAGVSPLTRRQQQLVCSCDQLLEVRQDHIIAADSGRAPSGSTSASDGPAEEAEPGEWEYEPRVWQPDEVGDVDPSSASSSSSQLILDDELATNDLDNQDPSGEWAQSAAAGGSTKDDVRTRSYFYGRQSSSSGNGSKDNKITWTRGSLPTSGRVQLKQQQQQRQQDDSKDKDKEEKCDQFRVDIRETVICDRRRCDKLDFEWPKHDNQLVVMETTRHGMRFHRAEFAFGSNELRSSPLATTTRAKFNPNKQHQQQQATLGTTNRRPAGGNSRIKFDLFELFKPKPSSSTTTTTTTTAKPATTTTTTTQKSPAEGDPDEPTATTTTAPTGSTTTTASGPSRQADDTSQDRNTTQLVTTFRLDTRRRMQTVLGFGGALSDSTCRNIKSLSGEMSASLMEDYFGTRGLRYTLARMTMGSSDFSTTPYTNNDKTSPASDDTSTAADSDADNNNNNHEEEGGDLDYSAASSLLKISSNRWALDEGDDVEMKQFRLVAEDYEFKLPVARQAIALSRHEVKFYSSLWSPPIWMKNNSHIVHGYLKGDIYGPYYRALADYMVKWLEAYRKNGIEFWATTGLNEPVTGIKPFIFHNSLGITRQDYVTFIKLYLGPMLRRRGFANVKLLAIDDNKGYMHQWVRALLEDKEAAKYVAGIGVHWYMNDEYENLNFLARDHPDKFILSTEASNGYLPFQVHTLPGDWDRGVAYMYDIIKLMQKNAVGWVDWNMALDLGGGPSWANNNLDAPVIVNADRDEYYKSPTFYALGHFSRFVEPNSTRLDHRLANARYDYPLEAVGFYTPRGYVVINVLNANKHRVPFKVIVDRQVVRVVNLREDSFNSIIFKWKSQR